MSKDFVRAIVLLHVLLGALAIAHAVSDEASWLRQLWPNY